MKYRFLAASAIMMAMPICVSAQDNINDAQYVVDQLISEELFQAAMQSTANLMAGSLQNEVSKQGKELSDNGAAILSDWMASYMASSMVMLMREDLVKVYEANFSPETLAAYRAFLQTPAGQDIAKAQTLLVKEGEAIGLKYGERVAIDAINKISMSIKADTWPEDTPTVIKEELALLFK